MNICYAVHVAKATDTNFTRPLVLFPTLQSGRSCCDVEVFNYELNDCTQCGSTGVSV